MTFDYVIYFLYLIYIIEEIIMYITCLDLEGVLVPEIWIAFADAVGIPELRRTTRDAPGSGSIFSIVA